MNTLKLAVLLFLAVLFLPSVAFYAANTDGFAVVPVQLLLHLSLATIGLALLLWVVLLPLNKNGKLFAIASGLILGVSVMALIQGNFLLWDFGPLDGRGIQWKLFKTHAYMELAAWLVVPLLFIIICTKRTDASKHLTNLILILNIVLILPILFSLQIVSPAQLPNAQPDSPFKFHKEKNTILLVLDTLQSDIFHELMETHPEELEFLSDFIFFPNTLGGFPTTRASVPLIISGEMYQNEESFEDWISKKVLNKTIIDFYEEKDFGTRIILNGPRTGISQNSMYMPFIQEYGLRRKLSKLFPVIDAGLFRSAPTLLKPKIYEEGNWLLTQTLQHENDPPGFHGADARFSRSLIDNISTDSENSGEFMYYHMRGAHRPLQVNEEFEFVGKMPLNRKSWLLQTRGVIKNVRDIFAALKSAGVYTNSTILIAGDHGTLPLPPRDLKREVIYPEEFSQGSARPLFLYKPATDAGAKLRVLDHPMHLADSACILSQWEAFCDEGFSNLDSMAQQRSRKFSSYEWGPGFFKKDKLPPITSYLVTGDVRDPDSWQLASESVDWIGCNESLNLENSDINSISNSKNGSAARKRYLSFGLSESAEPLRKGSGDRVSLWFHFLPNECQPTAIRISAQAFTPTKYPGQINSVILNGAELGVMRASQGNAKGEFYLPISEIREGENILEFSISSQSSSNKNAENSLVPKKWDLGIKSVEFIEMKGRALSEKR